MVPKTAAVLPLCMAVAILCSRWWCGRGSPVSAPTLMEGQGLLPKRFGCLNCHRDKKMA